LQSDIFQGVRSTCRIDKLPLAAGRLGTDGHLSQSWESAGCSIETKRATRKNTDGSILF
jgi:hypothetical protein